MAGAGAGEGAACVRQVDGLRQDGVRRPAREASIRCELDDRNEKIGYKIREARQVDRVPYMLILGGQEVENNTVSVRDRATDQTVTCTLDEFIAKISKEIADRV